MLYDVINSVKINIKKGKKNIKNLRHSKYIVSYFKKLKNLGYISDLTVKQCGKNKSIDMVLSDNLVGIEYNKVSQSIKLAEIKNKINFLDRQIGHILISTNCGILTGEQAIEQQLGGLNLGYVY